MAISFCLPVCSSVECEICDVIRNAAAPGGERGHIVWTPIHLFTSRSTAAWPFGEPWSTTLVHKCLNGRAPGYLADDFRLAGRGRPGSQSAASMMLDIARTTTSLGDRAFAVAGPRV